jgi:hypothetical protein
MQRSRQRTTIAFLLALFICLAVTARQVHKPNLADFQVYDAAAELVHEHRSIHMYDGADNEAVFQLKFADEQSPFGQAARHLGIDKVRLYIYPPILADFVLPFAFVSAATAGKLWDLLNLAAIFLIALLMARELNLRPTSLGGLAVLLGLFALFGTGMCLIWGQVTVLLLLLWMAGIHFYRRGWYAGSASVLAVATAIKLTPLLVIVPFLIWREWKWLRAYAVVLLACFVGMALVNTPASLTDYFFHVMPSMAGGGIPNFENKSIPAAMQLLYVTLHGGATQPVTMAIPTYIVTIGKAFSLAFVALAILCVYRVGFAMRGVDRRMTLALFALLSACIAPISWKHAYVVAFLPLGFFWAEAFRKQISGPRLTFLALCSIELGSFFFDSVATKATHGILFGLLSFLAPAAGVLLVFHGLLRMRPAQTA